MEAWINSVVTKRKTDERLRYKELLSQDQFCSGGHVVRPKQGLSLSLAP